MHDARRICILSIETKWFARFVHLVRVFAVVHHHTCNVRFMLVFGRHIAMSRGLFSENGHAAKIKIVQSCISVAKASIGLTKYDVLCLFEKRSTQLDAVVILYSCVAMQSSNDALHILYIEIVFFCSFIRLSHNRKRQRGSNAGFDREFCHNSI